MRYTRQKHQTPMGKELTIVLANGNEIASTTKGDRKANEIIARHKASRKEEASSKKEWRKNWGNRNQLGNQPKGEQP